MVIEEIDRELIEEGKKFTDDLDRIRKEVDRVSAKLDWIEEQINARKEEEKEEGGSPPNGSNVGNICRLGRWEDYLSSGDTEAYDP